ncbi:hypothetical protein L209DRAFT_738434 [Thermothelomyces heterothallicus CBS 203.75]
MGLVQYDSSDEDEEVQSPPTDPHPPNSAVKPTSPSSQKSGPGEFPPASGPSEPAAPLAQQQPEASSSSSSSSSAAAAAAAAEASASEAQASSAPDPAPALGPVLGPAFGPSRPPPKEERPRLEGELELELEGGRDGELGEVDLSFLDDAAGAGAGGGSPPRSPYARTRALLRNLTLPSVPNMDIPPSPPGSPPPHLDALTAKFDSFLRLKRTRGVHFNERLAASSGMANPAVADKLLAFAGVGTEFPADGDDGGGGGGGGRGLEQYATVLSPEVWDGGAGFPEWAFKGALRKTQERVSKERERARGEAVEFVSAGVLAPGAAGGGETAGSAGGSRAGTPGAGSGVGKRRGR